MDALSILLLGDVRRTEFLEARAGLDRWGDVTEFSDVDSASAALAAGLLSPDVIVVAQAFPGQFSHRAIDRLRRLAPLARVVGLLGSWCEGEMRQRLALAGHRTDVLASMAGPLAARVFTLEPRSIRLLGLAPHGHRGRAAFGRCWGKRRGERRGERGEGSEVERTGGRIARIPILISNP